MKPGTLGTLTWVLIDRALSAARLGFAGRRADLLRGTPLRLGGGAVAVLRFALIDVRSRTRGC